MTAHNKVCFRFRPPSAASIPTGPCHLGPGDSISVGNGEGPGNGTVEGRFGNSRTVMGNRREQVCCSPAEMETGVSALQMKAGPENES